MPPGSLSPIGRSDVCGLAVPFLGRDPGVSQLLADLVVSMIRHLDAVGLEGRYRFRWLFIAQRRAR